MRKLVKKNILIIEPSKTFQDLLKQEINKRFYCEFFIAETFLEAKKLMRGGEFHYALVNLVLPDAKMGDAARLTSSQGVSTFVITSSQDEEVFELINSYKIVDYITKESKENIDYLIELMVQLDINCDFVAIVADDSDVALKSFGNLLKMMQFQVFMAKNGKEALQLIEEHDAKLLLTDYHMPEMNGYELIVEARKQRNERRLIIFAMSEVANELNITKMLKAGANDFVYKSVNRSNLITRIFKSIRSMDLFQELKKDYVHLQREHKRLQKEAQKKSNLR